MNKYIVAGALAVIAVLIAVFAFSPHSSAPSTPLVANSKTYTNTTYDFSFSYPDDYLFTEQTSTSVYSLILTRKEDVPPPQNSEAPPTISISVYPNPTSTPLADWLTTNGTETNYALPNTATSATVIAGNVPAVGYLWEGLYQGLSIALEHNNNVIIFTGMYNNPTDQIVKDFEYIIASVKVQ